MSGEQLALAIVALFGSALALIRASLGQQKSVTERFVAYLEQSSREILDNNRRLTQAVDALGTGVRENTLLIRSVAESLKAPRGGGHEFDD